MRNASPPDGAREHGHGEVRGRAARDHADQGLDRNESERQSNEQPVAAGPALEGVHDDRSGAGGGHARRPPGQAEAGVERGDRKDALAEEAGRAAQQDRDDRRLGQAVFAVSALNRRSCSVHHSIPHS